MQYAVLSKLAQPQGRVVCDVEAPVPVGVGAEFRGPVRGRIELTNTGAVISARGRLRATAVCECARCLARHEVVLEVEVNEECALTQIEAPPSFAAGEEPPIPLLDDDAVDLTELVRQVLVISVPPRSLCRPECRGLCPECGQDLNRGPCTCGAGATDPRWSGLQELRGRD